MEIQKILDVLGKRNFVMSISHLQLGTGKSQEMEVSDEDTDDDVLERSDAAFDRESNGKIMEFGRKAKQRHHELNLVSALHLREGTKRVTIFAPSKDVLSFVVEKSYMFNINILSDASFPTNA